jgi:probable phosphoglycerate mutase
MRHDVAMRVVLVRHGETAWSRAGKHTGRTDIPLLDEGRHQAEQLGARLRSFSFAAVWSSPLSRARDTCALAGFADQARLDDDLLEWDYGAYEGRRSADIVAERPGWNLFFDGCPDGEVFIDVVRRVDRVIDRVGSVDGDVALFAHGHLLRTLGARWLQMGPELATALLLSPASVSILRRDRNAPVAALWNDARQLEAP